MGVGEAAAATAAETAVTGKVKRERQRGEVSCKLCLFFVMTLKKYLFLHVYLPLFKLELKIGDQ